MKAEIDKQKNEHGMMIKQKEMESMMSKDNDTSKQQKIDEMISENVQVK